MEGVSLVDLQGRILDVAEDLSGDIRHSNFNLFLVPCSLDGNLGNLFLFTIGNKYDTNKRQDKSHIRPCSNI